MFMDYSRDCCNQNQDAFPPPQVGRRSWAPGEDIDCLLRERTLLHITGDARARLAHGIRSGVDRGELAQSGVYMEETAGAGELGDAALYDWWGSIHEPIERRPGRLSLVYAFADVEEDFAE